MKNTNAYCVTVQAGPDEVLKVSSPDDLNLEQLAAHAGAREFVVALPDIEQAQEAASRLSEWNVRCWIGDPYNVARRILEVHDRFFQQDFCVRVLAIWKNIDFAYVDRMVDRMRCDKPDAVLPPRDYDVTMCADLVSLDALRRIAGLGGDFPETHQAHFNPWGYMDIHPEMFHVHYEEPAPLYDQARRDAVLASGRCHPENEYYGRGYSGSRYHFLLPFIRKTDRILDIACGSGSGTHLVSQAASMAVGADYMDEYVRLARQRYPEDRRLHFIEGDGQTFLHQGKEGQFDLVISLHTLEHVPDDRSMLASLRQNLVRGGRLIVEVPLLARRPLGVPINPYHLREYRADQFIRMVEQAGFQIERVLGASRGFYVPPEKARDALQVHAVRI